MTDEFSHHAYNVWLLAGVILMLLEAFGLPGTGVMFAGLGAVTAGAAIYVEALGNEAYTAQWVVFFIATAFWTALLWKPLKKARSRPAGYNNIIGDTAYVGSNGLTKQAGGEVTWSGTIMKAQLARHSPVDSVEAGSQVTIVAVTGATLTVMPKA